MATKKKKTETTTKQSKSSKKITLAHPGKFDLRRPLKPTKPDVQATITQERVFFESSTKNSKGESIKLLDALQQKMPAGFPIENLSLVVKRVGNPHDVSSINAVMQICQDGSVENPDYAPAMAQHEEDLKKHENAVQIFEKAKRSHEDLSKLYDEVERYQDLGGEKKSATAAKMKGGLADRLEVVFGTKVSPDNIKLT